MIEDIRYSGKINWPILAAFIALMVILLLYFDKAIAADNKDPKAVEIAQQTIQAMGGMDAWKATPAIRFNFVVEVEGQEPRSVKHLWDRARGRDHVDGKTREGKARTAWIDLHTREGAAWEDGRKLEGDELKKAMEWAFGRWVNDTYWLIMPLKMLDGGVNLKYEGEKDNHHILHLSFQGVGLTPGDQYWAHIDKSTKLMNKWEFLLQNEKEKESHNWVEWGTFGKMKFSKLKQSSDKKFGIRFEPLQVLDSADASYFGSELKTLD